MYPTSLFSALEDRLTSIQRAAEKAKYRKLVDREAFKGEIELICCTLAPVLNRGSF
jgi:hypothetical protein